MRFDRTSLLASVAIAFSLLGIFACLAGGIWKVLREKEGATNHATTFSFARQRAMLEQLHQSSLFEKNMWSSNFTSVSFQQVQSMDPPGGNAQHQENESELESLSSSKYETLRMSPDEQATTEDDSPILTAAPSSSHPDTAPEYLMSVEDPSIGGGCCVPPVSAPWRSAEKYEGQVDAPPFVKSNVDETYEEDDEPRFDHSGCDTVGVKREVSFSTDQAEETVLVEPPPPPAQMASHLPHQDEEAPRTTRERLVELAKSIVLTADAEFEANLRSNLPGRLVGRRMSGTQHAKRRMAFASVCVLAWVRACVRVCVCVCVYCAEEPEVRRRPQLRRTGYRKGPRNRMARCAGAGCVLSQLSDLASNRNAALFLFHNAP